MPRVERAHGQLGAVLVFVEELALAREGEGGGQPMRAAAERAKRRAAASQRFRLVQDAPVEGQSLIGADDTARPAGGR